MSRSGSGLFSSLWILAVSYEVLDTWRTMEYECAQWLPNWGTLIFSTCNFNCRLGQLWEHLYTEHAFIIMACDIARHRFMYHHSLLCAGFSCHTPLSPKPPKIPLPNPADLPPVLPVLLMILPCSLTPLTTLSSPVSTTTPPTIISPSTACSVSKWKIKSSSQTFSKSRSRASTNT